MNGSWLMVRTMVSPTLAQWVPGGSQWPLGSRSHRSHRSWAAPPAQASGGVAPRPPDRPAAGSWELNPEDRFRTPNFLYGRFEQMDPIWFPMGNSHLFGKSENMGEFPISETSWMGKCRLKSESALLEVNGKMMIDPWAMDLYRSYIRSRKRFDLMRRQNP